MTKEYLFVVLSNSAEGQEERFNTWYDEQHLDDVLNVPGFKTAQRFRLKATPGGAPVDWRYLAVYGAQTDSPEKLLEELVSRAGTPEMPLDESVGAGMVAMLFESIGPELSSSKRSS